MWDAFCSLVSACGLICLYLVDAVWMSASAGQHLCMLLAYKWTASTPLFFPHVVSSCTSRDRIRAQMVFDFSTNGLVLVESDTTTSVVTPLFPPHLPLLSICTLSRHIWGLQATICLWQVCPQYEPRRTQMERIVRRVVYSPLKHAPIQSQRCACVSCCFLSFIEYLKRQNI